jgi:hypothetical protein
MSRETSRPLPARKTTQLLLTVKAEFIPLFFPLLQKGFAHEVRTGGSVRELLTGQFDLSSEYIEKRIQTIFLNGKPIDDMDTAIVRDGSTLALSSALPGVLGATLRRGGYYSRMRSQITHVEEAETAETTDGQIVVKLFNLTIRELGPFFLARGIGMDAEDARDFFRSLPPDLQGELIAAQVDGKNVDTAGISSWNFTAERVYLQLKTV